jgi:hypothetical protein
MIAPNEKPRSSLVERTRTKHLSTELGPVKIAHRGNKTQFEVANGVILRLRD